MQPAADEGDIVRVDATGQIVCFDREELTLKILLSELSDTSRAGSKGENDVGIARACHVQVIGARLDCQTAWVGQLQIGNALSPTRTAQGQYDVLVLTSEKDGEASAFQSVPPCATDFVSQERGIDTFSITPLAHNLERIAMLGVVMCPESFH